MSQLAQRLSTYYTRKNNRIIFNELFTLNGLAVEMYTRLNYTQIDPSVISRVLKGKRLFTVKQLQIFCEVLNLPGSEQTKLFEALQEDHLVKKGYRQTGLTQASFNDKLDVIDTLIKEAFAIYYEGRCISVSRLFVIIDNYIHQCPLKALSPIQQDKLYELMGLRLYLEGRIIGCMSLAHTAIPEMISITDKLFLLGNTSKINKLYAYANVLLSDAYYIAGGYSADEEKRSLYLNSIEYGKKSLPFFSGKDRNRIVALRNIAASTIYLGDELSFLSLKKTAEDMIESQPSENRVYMLHFCGTIAKGEAYFNHPNPLLMKEKGVTHFGKTLSGKGAFEISDTRAELETLLLLGSRDTTYMSSLLMKGSLLADHEKMVRYKEYFNKIHSSIRS